MKPGACSSGAVVVVGGGHAGIEAAVAAARRGARTTLVTLDAAAVGRMSCNPSIGGIGKGQMVRELDALGGVMGRIADRSAIHFRLLNRSKGAAVQSPRTQNDRAAYAREARAAVEDAGVAIVEGEVVDLLVVEGRVSGVVLAGVGVIPASAVVLTTGTFLGGVLHVGEESSVGGRLGEGAAHLLAERLRALGCRMGRLKTGTPPRLLSRSIDWSRTEPQPSDDDPVPFSFEPEPTLPGRIACALTRTTPEVHELVAAALDRSPLFSGRIRGRGPRYCPSIEDKIFRFADRDSHQVFLEPEGLDSPLVYPNGISTSLPRDVQERFVRAIPGLEAVEFAAYGYAVEYDHVDPTECQSTLECRRLPGLFLAGQINGTTGYEEAAAQGFVAGVNAARETVGGEPFVLGRHEAYIGVMIDDLVTRGVEEPYRMFTSLAEHRILLRHQDADLRLLGRAEALGIAPADRLARTRARAARRERARELLRARRTREGVLFDSLRRPGFTFDDAVRLEPALAMLELDRRDRDELFLEAAYETYADRERQAIELRRDAEERMLPDGLDYQGVPHLRMEAREKLGRLRPRSIGQAARISGIAPSDISVLMIHLAATGGGERP